MIESRNSRITSIPFNGIAPDRPTIGRSVLGSRVKRLWDHDVGDHQQRVRSVRARQRATATPQDRTGRGRPSARSRDSDGGTGPTGLGPDASVYGPKAYRRRRKRSTPCFHGIGVKVHHSKNRPTLTLKSPSRSGMVSSSSAASKQLNPSSR
jgi:hypothetical protein